MHTLDQLRSGQLAGAERLTIAAGLTTFPDEIFDLADSLQILDLSHNQLRNLPDTLPRLKKLSILFLNHNAFETVPEVLAQCPNLTMIGLKANRLTWLPEEALPPQTRWLILTDNQLTTLPKSIGSLKRLQKLMLAGNQLQTLPEDMAACLNLELIRLAANQLEELPPWLLTLPRLAWLAFAGNPFCQTWSNHPRSIAPLATIDWSDLTPGAVLGQGASGVICQGLWQTPREKTEVAIKLFKGQITSDGYPADEMRACLAAGTQANLISPIGQVVNHPDQKQGLVFPLIPASYGNLGGPPNLDTCTRDTYPAATRFSPAVAWRIATSLAAAAAHLHQQGILHGDLYAHNTLVNPEGTALLGDFGAASFYPAHPRSLGESLERIEVRAFGCLLEDLLEHGIEPADDQQRALTQALRSLQQDCMKPTPQMRPLFKDILSLLQGLSA